ncbi:MAG: carboxypeptidase regulatory-like domain-containing protein [Candidatus Acidiferrales bacterium]
MKPADNDRRPGAVSKLSKRGMNLRAAQLLHRSPHCWVLFAALMLGVPVARGQIKSTLQGIIRDPAGGVVAGATVTIYSPERVWQTDSDAEGRFGFADLPAGRFTLEAESPGFKTKVIEGVRVAEKVLPPISVDLELEPNSGCGRFFSALYVKDNLFKTNLKGTVRYYYGEPLPKVRLSVSKSDESFVLASQMANEKGEFQFEALEPGRYALTASLEGHSDYRTQPFSIIRETLTRIKLMMLKEGEMIICE